MSSILTPVETNLFQECSDIATDIIEFVQSAISDDHKYVISPENIFDTIVPKVSKFRESWGFINPDVRRINPKRISIAIKIKDSALYILSASPKGNPIEFFHVQLFVILTGVLVTLTKNRQLRRIVIDKAKEFSDVGIEPYICSPLYHEIIQEVE